MADPDLKDAYGKLFVELWEPLASTHAARADAIGISRPAAVDKAHGRKLPDPYARLLTCIAIAQLRRLKTDSSRKAFLKRGLDFMRQLEGKEDT